ncbi:hypothetical protein Syun_012299 [Stephania yunnanensis]|uniref:Uncharacterized protein n=1 Tax=Stephania yunnanensis TaxID=152371 RepID=A0AAP0PHD9_9MAGN
MGWSCRGTAEAGPGPGPGMGPHSPLFWSTEESTPPFHIALAIALFSLSNSAMLSLPFVTTTFGLLASQPQ